LDWTEYTGTAIAGLQNTNYSPQTQITASNINQIQVSWLFPIPSALASPTAFATRVTGYTFSSGNEGTQSAVLTANGIAYTLTNYLDIYGINLATGAQLAQPASCTVPTGSSLGSVIAADVKAAPAGATGTPCLGAPGEMDPAYDFAYWLTQPMASGGPSHQHGWNIVAAPGVGDVAWIPGWGCNIQGWQVSTGQLVANLTGMCGSKANPVPGTISPVVGSGKMASNGIGEVQVDAKYNEIIFWASGSSEGSGGFVDNVFACSLSLALANYLPGVGSTCAPNYSSADKGGACNTTAGGLCDSGSTMIWRTFLMPAYDGSTPNFATQLCAKGHIWIVGVPCQSVEQVNANIIQNDGQRPDLAVAQNGGDPVFPSTGCSGSWGQIALDDANGIMAIGTGDTGPDWNSTLRMGFSILCNAVVGLNLQNGTVMWSDKSFTKDINDQDCNLNTSVVTLGAAGSPNNPSSFSTGNPISDSPTNVPLTGSLMPNGGPVFVKTCKSSMTYAMNGITGQPLWYLDPSMPDYSTIHSATTSAQSRAMICSPTNATACDIGRVWDQIAHLIVQNDTYPNSVNVAKSTLKMQGTNPHPHGFITGGPARGGANLDPLNNTEVGTCTGVGTSGNTCTPGATCPSGMHADCVANDVQGKGAGYYEERYMAESENAIDPTNGLFFAVVMHGPAEHDWIGDVAKQGQSGNVSGSSLYFSGVEGTNSTEFAIQISTGQVLWAYQRPIYYRGGVIATGGMIIGDWPDGHLIFNSETTGAVLKDINVGVPLLAPISIAPDLNGVMHLLISYGGVNHGNLGEPSIHGVLGRGTVTTGAVISYVLGPAPASTSASTTTVTSVGSTTVTSTVVIGGSTSTITSVQSSTVTSVSTVSGSISTVTSSVGTSGVSDLAFYGAVGVAAILAIVAGALVVLRRRPSA